MTIPSIEDIIRQDIQTLRDCPQADNCAACKEELCVMVPAAKALPLT
jgi:hypothetical protein